MLCQWVILLSPSARPRPAASGAGRMRQRDPAKAEGHLPGDALPGEAVSAQTRTHLASFSSYARRVLHGSGHSSGCEGMDA